MKSPKTLRNMAGLSQTPAKLADSVVLVIDAQNEYLTGNLPLHGMAESIEKLATFLVRARKEGAQIIHIVHHGAPGGLLFDPEGEASHIIQEIHPTDNEQVVIKKFPSSFTGTPLLELLQESGRTDLVITGYMTHMCVNSTTREATEKGFRCSVIKSLTATRELPDGNGGTISAEQVKHINLASLADRFAIILTDTDDLP